MEFIDVEPGGPARIGRIEPSQVRDLRAMFDRYEFRREIQVPSLRRMDLNTATLELEARGLKRGRVKEEPSTNVPNGFVLRQSIPPGTLVGEGTVVDLVIGRPTEPVRVRVPKVNTMRLEQAIDTLERRGLRVGRITGPKRGERWVVTQSPAPGVLVPKGSSIDLQVQEVIQ
jgi:beta-lactam-binding protein with PASTA domain